MSDVVGSQKVDFTFVWRIENFSLIRQRCASPIFIADTLRTSRWRLYLNLQDDKSQDFELVQFDKKELPVYLFYELSILGDGGLKEKSVALSKLFMHKSSYPTPPLQIPQDIFNKREILPGDTLTVLCKIWEPKEQFLEMGFSFARTRIGAERKSFIWSIENFSTFQEYEERTISVELCSYRELSLAIILCLASGRGEIEIKVEGNNDETVDFTIVLGISVQNINDEVVYPFKEELTFAKGKKTFYFVTCMLKEDLIANKDLLLPDDVLSLKCVLVVSKGAIVLNEIERTTYGADAEIDLAAALTNTPEPPFLGNEAHSSSNSFTNDMRHLFEDKYHADISLRVRNETFNLHKAILSARSSVFKTMLDTDMAEKLTNTIEIDDFEPDIIRRLLLYVYSDTLDSNIDWKNAFNLYLAAEKYAVLGLKEKCSCFLKMNLNTENVCEIIVLADMLKDEGLKNYAQSFIQDRASAVIISDEWKLFTQEHAQLAIEILTHLCMNKMECEGKFPSIVILSYSL
ncbi:Speckle-type POZ protein B [Araneus ventricosus]|uniref:Speckle-type POZ protein B n=1 Tax=Araneus ventricosus TaxID=182803 RepID=A0A4Y2TEV5_ARAVE|nr:Speckle-type POZ protein B [Araneus ventricosus]